MNSRKVYVLLQEYKCIFGRVCQFVKGGRYNHASIGFEDSIDVFYSFRSKWGLCIEHPFDFNKNHKRDIQCIIYEIEVNEAQYLTMRQSIDYFLSTKEDYYYSYPSLVLGFLGIRHNFKRGYTCSNFVAEVLKKSDIIKFRKHESVYMPCDFERELEHFCFEGFAREFNLSLYS